ncbi:hypothetical protein Tco_0488526 [Tanacetum coccineum]
MCPLSTSRSYTMALDVSGPIQADFVLCRDSCGLMSIALRHDKLGQIVEGPYEVTEALGKEHTKHAVHGGGELSLVEYSVPTRRLHAPITPRGKKDE